MSKSIIMAVAVVLLSIASAHAQIKNEKTTTIKVYGNCEMCETTIEKAAFNKNISKADWSKETKMATITYDSSKTTVDAVLKNIALAGYDNTQFLAPEEAYNKLPGCCKYVREGKPVAKMDHSKMDHSKMDHSKMDQSKMDHSKMDHSKMDHSKMDHSKMDQTKTAMKHDEHAGHDMPMQSTNKQEVNQLQTVFDNYFFVKDALVLTDGATASAKAGTLLAAINAVKMENLKADEHTVWMKVLDNLKLDVKRIIETKEASSQREHFTTLSKNMYDLIKVSKPATPVYYQNCPMYNDGKGANWLSKESAIKNPYYGKMMLTCGKTIETLK